MEGMENKIGGEKASRKRENCHNILTACGNMLSYDGVVASTCGQNAAALTNWAVQSVTVTRPVRGTFKDLILLCTQLPLKLVCCTAKLD